MGARWMHHSLILIAYYCWCCCCPYIITTTISFAEAFHLNHPSSKIIPRFYRTATTSVTTTKRSVLLLQRQVVMMSSSASQDSSLSKLQNTNNHVVVIGSANYDLTVYTPCIPTLGETVLGTNFQTSCGGKGGNQAMACSALGLSKTTFLCRVGDDLFGHTLIKNFQSNNVNLNESNCFVQDNAQQLDDKNDTNDTESKERIPASTGVACITVDTTNGNNFIIVAPGTNLQLSPVDVRNELLEMKNNDDATPTVVLVQLEIPYETALEAFKVAKIQLNAITILNPAPAPSNNHYVSVLNDMLQYVDIIVPNESELRTLYTNYVTRNTGDDSDTNKGQIVDENEEVMMAKTLLEHSVRIAVIVTLGERGAMIVTKDGAVTYCTAPNDCLPNADQPVIDTIGAGDGFCGSLASYIAAGITTTSDDNNNNNVLLSKAVALACGFASMSVRKRGANYPSIDELPSCLRITTSIASNAGGATSKRQKMIATKPTLTFVTGNKNKLAEVQKILSSSNGNDKEFPYDIVNEKIDLPELQGNDTIEIAREKCRLASKRIKSSPSGTLCMTEDTSLCFNALNGMPGPYIKWFLENCGHDGLNRMLHGFDDKTAYAVTIIALTIVRNDGKENNGKANDDDVIHIFEGRTDGIIVPPRGSLEFGWDPIFQPIESVDGKTYAEMTKDEKNSISHRGRAFAKLREYLMNN